MSVSFCGNYQILKPLPKEKANTNIQTKQGWTL